MPSPEAFDLQSPVSLSQFFQRLFSADFMPHGHCFFWRPDVLWLNVISDGMIAIAYFAIPVSLVIVYRKRKDIPFHWMFQMFAAFILLCGLTHVMGVVTTWKPYYRIEGLVKLVTGIVSLATVYALQPVLPKVLNLPSYEAMNEKLFTKTQELEKINRDLEDFNRIAVGREKQMMQLKIEINALLKDIGRPPRYKI